MPRDLRRSDPQSISRDIFGNTVNWTATARRIVDDRGRLHCELRRDGSVIWPFCRPAEGCRECESRVAHLCLVKEEEEETNAA